MGQERVSIIIQEKGSRVVQRRLKDVGTTAARSARGVGLLRTALLGVGAGLALRSTIRTIASFEQALSTVKAVAGATEAEFAQLTGTARELGATTRFTATQAGEALVELSRAGFEVNESLTSVRDTLLLAQAGSLDLKRAAELTAGAIRGYHLEADQAGRVTDVLAFAANSASTDVNQLGEAMKFVAPAAYGLNVSLEESVAALQALADSQLKGSLGGTGLRQVMIALEAPAAKTKRILSKVGLSVDQVRISSVGLTTALQNMAEAGITTGQAYEIFGRRGGGAASVLFNSVPKIKENTAALLDSKGAAQEVAEIMDDNLNGALLRVKSAFEAVQLSLGAADWSDTLQGILNGTATALRYLAENIEIVQGALYALAITSIPTLISALTLLAPLLGMVAIGAGIGALVAFRREILLSKDSVTDLGDFGSAALERLKEGGQIALDFFKNQFGGVTSVFDDLEFSIGDMVSLTARALDRWIGFWRGAINVVVAIFKQLGPALKDIMIDTVNDIFNVLDAGLRRFYTTLGQIPGRVGEPYRRLARDGVIPRMENVAEGSTELLAQSIKDGFAQGFEDTTVFEDSVNSMFDRADAIAQERIAKLTQVTGPDLSTAAGTGVAPTPEGDPVQRLSQLQIGVQGGLEKLGETINQWGTQVEATMVNAFSSAEDALVSFVTTGKLDFKSLVDSILADLTRLLARQAISGLLNSMGGAGGIFGSIANAFGAGKANGGDVRPGIVYPVGERGPELFSPSVPGKIISNETVRQAGSGASGSTGGGNITIINVSSKEEALAALESSEGQRVVVNYMDERDRERQVG